MRLIYVLIALSITQTIVTLLVHGDEPKETSVPADAVLMACQDLAGLPISDRPFALYVWDIPTIESWQRINSFAVNMAASQSAAIIYPDVAGRGNLLRWDVRRLGVTEAGTERLIKLLLETVPLDPFFYENASTVVVHPTTQRQAKITVPRFLHSDGRYYTARWIPWDELPDGAYYLDERTVVLAESVAGDATKNVRQLATHLGIEQRELLVKLSLGNPAPIVSSRHLFEVLATTTGIGRYYDFVGVSGLNRNEILASLGASKEASGKLNALTGWAFVQSKVTGKWRVAIWFTGATGTTFVTLDFDDQQKSSRQNPFYQLLGTLDGFLTDKNPVHVAEEILSFRPNGSQLGYLINPKTGELVDSVPENIAKDHNIPSPHELGGSGSALLIPNTGCIICHGPNAGYQPLTTVLKPSRLQKLDILDDLKARNDFEAIDRLASVFGKGADGLTTLRALTRAREDYSQFVFRSTKGWRVSEMADALKEYYYGWAYNLVTPRQAALEMGYVVEDDEAAVELLEQLIPPAKPIEGGPSYEDRTIGFIKAGIPVQRSAFNEVYGHAMTRREPLTKEEKR